MIVNDLLKDVAGRGTQSLTQTLVNSGETLETFLLRVFNMFHKNFNKRRNWSWLQKETVIQTVPNYETGTVTVTAGSRTVTGLNTVWTSAMVGRMFKLNREDELYEIIAVASSTSLTLRTPYIATGDSGLEYLIWKKKYSLDPDIPFLSELNLSKFPDFSENIPKKSFNKQSVKGYETSVVPNSWAWYGIDRSVSTYSPSGSTVTATKGSRTFTFSGTSLLDNVFNGSFITIGNDKYNVESVDSDTQITTVQVAKSAISNTTFSIETKGRSQIVLSSVPDPATNLYISYYKRVYDLGKDDDIIVWDEYSHILTNVVYAYLLEKLTDNKSFNWLAVYDGEINKVFESLNENDASETVPVVSQRTDFDVNWR